MISVVYRSDDYWVITKPAGMSFHSESTDAGVMRSLAGQYPEQTFYPVHRLDKMTSGLLIVACHSKAAATFGAMFEAHSIEKRYVALSKRKPKKKQGSVIGGMEPSRRGQWRLTKGVENLARTQFFSKHFQDVRVFFLRPLTGKTHQLRVALKSLSAPIHGDERYAGDPADRGYLHAYRLSFEWQGERKQYVSAPFGGELFSQELSSFIDDHFKEANLSWPQHK
ncbi:pseudouridine synthase [Marinomonas sp.]